MGIFEDIKTKIADKRDEMDKAKLERLERQAKDEETRAARVSAQRIQVERIAKAKQEQLRYEDARASIRETDRKISARRMEPVNDFLKGANNFFGGASKQIRKAQPEIRAAKARYDYVGAALGNPSTGSKHKAKKVKQKKFDLSDVL